MKDYLWALAFFVVIALGIAGMIYVDAHVWVCFTDITCDEKAPVPHHKGWGWI